MASDVTVFPDPDSPTIPRLSFGRTSKLTPSTAFTSPSSVGNSTRRLRTVSNALSGATNGVSSPWTS
jgi:hypothetical protein